VELIGEIAKFVHQPLGSIELQLAPTYVHNAHSFLLGLYFKCLPECLALIGFKLFVTLCFLCNPNPVNCQEVFTLETATNCKTVVGGSLNCPSAFQVLLIQCSVAKVVEVRHLHISSLEKQSVKEAGEVDLQKSL